MNEDQLIARLLGTLPQHTEDVIVPPGDDCAAIQWTSDTAMLIAVDQLVEGRHYAPDGEDGSSCALAGRKLLARNLSDIAAMGGAPQYALLAVSTPQEHTEDDIEQFFAGIRDLAGTYDVQLIGGDVSGTDGPLVSSITITGRVNPERICRRRGARAGDLLLATGWFGDSVASGHHLNFNPRCREAAWLAASGAVTAMIDVSDGLLIDLQRLCRASGVSVSLDTDAVLRREHRTTVQSVLSEGEDYELLFAVPPEKAGDLRNKWPFSDLPLSCIGTFRESENESVTVRGKSAPEKPPKSGWDHFA